MRKKMVLSLGILSMFLFVATICNPASAATYAVGVNLGGTADYEISTTMSDIENATKMHVYVYGIVGTAVTLNFTYTLKNGTTTKPEQSSGDLAGSNSIWIYLIAKNLTTNDLIYPTSAWSINNTETMTAAGASRTVCHLNSSFIFASGNAYWDKETGILVQCKLHFITIWPFSSSWLNITMTSTSMWSAGGLFGLSTTTLLIIAAVAIVLIAVIALAVRRGGKKKR